MSIFGQFTVGQWKVGKSRRIAFPVVTVQERGGNRIIERERPYRDAAKLDDTGSKSFRWTVDAIFENSIQESGLESLNGDTPLYPDVMNELIETFSTHETGDLSIPTRGWVRARIESYDRIESPDDYDAGKLTMVFVEDNEDSVERRAFAVPTVTANAQRLSQQTTFDQQSAGIWGDDSVSLEEFAAGMETWANAPGDTANDVDAKASSTVGSANRILRAFSVSDREGRDPLRNPENSATARKLNATKDIAGRSAMEQRKGKPQKVMVVFEHEQSLATISAMLGQDYEDLLAMNPKIEDPFYIPAGTAIWVYA